jgi:hypothetical protein
VIKMLCPYCQLDNPDGSLFCIYCAMPLATTQNSGLQLKPSTISTTGNNSSQGTINGSPHLQLYAGPRNSGIQAKLVVIENMQPTGESIPLPSPPYDSSIIIGRNDLINGKVVDLDLVRVGGFDKRVSRIHATLGYDTDHFYIEDLGSSHGTFVNKTKLLKGNKQPLKTGDEIRLAELVLRLEIS